MATAETCDAMRTGRSDPAVVEIDDQAQRLPCRREEEHYVVLEVLDEAPNQLTLRLLNEYKVKPLDSQHHCMQSDSDSKASHTLPGP